MNFQSDSSCVVCGESGTGKVCYHHLLTRKARPDLTNEPRNMISVCQRHHNEFHSKGIGYMANKFPLVKEWLISNGWHICELTNKWRM